MRTYVLAAGIALVTMMAGCGAGSDSDRTGADARNAPLVAADWKEDRLHVDVPTPVVMLGFTDANVAAVRAKLTRQKVDQHSGDLNQTLPPDPEEIQEHGPLGNLPLLFGETIELPMVPTAVYDVQAAPPALVAEFSAALAAAKLAEGVYDANAMEDFLAGALPRHGFAVNPNAPSFVVLHLRDFGVGEHGWRIQGVTGKLEPVRLFGERHPLLVLDTSAVADPYNAGGTESYRGPVSPGSAPTIAEFVRDATEFRMLQGSIYPVAQAPCHAVTGIMGVRPTSLAQTGLIQRPVEEALVAERIKASFDHLTGTDVFFDLKVLTLPVDDPALDAITRGEFPLVEVLRFYLTVMWDSYHVDHPGCEEYLSVVVQSDAAAVPGGGILGIGTYDDKPGKRISMSWVHEIFRLLLDPESPGCAVGQEVFSPNYCQNKDYMNWWEYLLSHETGHLFGQRHPHDLDSSSASRTSSNAFTSVWSSMSYQQDGRMIDFGAIDHNNWLRNRAAFALGIAAENGRVGTPEWEVSLAAARQLDWHGVWAALQPGANE